MPELRKEARAKMETLAQFKGVVGAMLVSRDGINVLDVLNRPFNQEMFAAMSAMMMGAAETAVSELGEGSPRHLTVETTDLNIVVRGISDELLLVLLGEPGLDMNGVEAKVEELVDHVRGLSG